MAHQKSRREEKLAVRDFWYNFNTDTGEQKKKENSAKKPVRKFEDKDSDKERAMNRQNFYRGFRK